MRNLPTYEQWKSEPINESWKIGLAPNEIEMIKGIVDILLQIKDINNRKEVANTRIEDFKKEGIKRTSPKSESITEKRN